VWDRTQIHTWGWQENMKERDSLEDVALPNRIILQGDSNMTGTDVARFTHKSVPVIFEPPCKTDLVDIECDDMDWTHLPHYKDK